MLHIVSAPRKHRAAWLIVLGVAALLPLRLGARDNPQALEPAAIEGTRASGPVLPAADDPRRVDPTSTTARQATVAVAQKGAADPTVEAMLQAIEEQSRVRRELQSTIRTADELKEAMRRQEVVHVWNDQATLEAQRQIERSLQELVEEFERARSRVVLEEVERGRLATAEERAQAEAARLEEQERAVRAARDDDTAILRQQLDALRRQQDILVRQLQQIADQQQALLEAQRRLSDEAARIRRQVERR